MHPIVKFLVICSAAVEDIIERPQCRGDAKKYAMVGAFVLLTAGFAFASGGFAIYTGFQSAPLAVALGLAWAVMIFCIDRYVVSGIRKSDVEGLAFFARWKVIGYEWVVAAPRLALAALISVVIATPLELRFFEREINARIAANHLAESQKAQNDIGREFGDVQALTDENQRLESETNALRNAHLNMKEAATRELAGIEGSGRRGKGEVYNERIKQADQLAELWRNTKTKNDALIRANEQKIREREAERGKRVSARNTVVGRSDGFLSRYRALSEMSDEDSRVGRATTFMSLLFLCIELTPVLMKMLLRRGPYDEFIETLEHTVRVEQLKARSDINDDAHADVVLHSLRNQRRIALEEEMTRAVDLDAVKAAAPDDFETAVTRIAKAAIQDWVRNQTGPKPRIPIRTPGP